MAGENQSPTWEFLLQEFLLNGDQQEVLFLLFYAIILMGELGPIFQLGQYILCVQYCSLSLSFFVDLCYFSQILYTLAQNLAAVNFVHTYFPNVSTPTKQFLQLLVIYDPYVSVSPSLLLFSNYVQEGLQSSGNGLFCLWFSQHDDILSFSFLVLFYSNIFHFLSCPDPQIFILASLDTCPQGNQLFIIGTVNFTSSLLTVLISFVCILAVFFKILYFKRRFKAFSSCISHLLVSSLVYETSLFGWVTQFNSTSTLNYDQTE